MFLSMVIIFLAVKPKFTILPKNMTATPGGSMLIDCAAAGFPMPTIQWDKNTVVNGFDERRFKVRTRENYHHMYLAKKQA